MARRSYAGFIGAGVVAVGLMGFAGTAAAQNKLELGADTWLTTDYEFRGISQTNHNPAVQGEFTATYGMFYADIWASSLDFGDNTPLEIDYYGGITPTWNGLNFDFGILGYTYPDAAQSNYNYFELKAHVDKNFMNDKLNLGYTTYWTPDNFGGLGDNWVFEGTAGYSFDKVWIFSPSVSGTLGYNDAIESAGLDYTYWNLGVTLGFAEKFAVDLRYWDTNASTADCGSNLCDARIVGTLSASF
jgi:uncharacterized protein (TIGR02001 family)